MGIALRLVVGVDFARASCDSRTLDTVVYRNATPHIVLADPASS